MKKAILRHLSVRLADKYGQEWSVEALTLCRKLYSMYSHFVNRVYGIAPRNYSGT
ncbi:MAG: hypothetical protein J6Y37_10755 [Paludibacteraceae bacterium]|nr:hypothetical protein [Paludibacteraceae bacterium]